MKGLEIEGALTFFYYKDLEDLEKSSKFYADVMGFERVMDKDWVKLFKIIGGAHLGLVRADRGSHKPSPTKPVRLQVMVSNIDAWFNYMKEKGIELNRESPNTSSELNIKTFTVMDPEGYTIEFCEYTTPYGL